MLIPVQYKRIFCHYYKLLSNFGINICTASDLKSFDKFQGNFQSGQKSVTAALDENIICFLLSYALINKVQSQNTKITLSICKAYSELMQPT